MAVNEKGEEVLESSEVGRPETEVTGQDSIVQSSIEYDEDEERPFDLGPADKIENPMQRPILSKVVVNIGVGEPGEKVVRAANLLEGLTGQKAVRTAARRTNRDLGVRKSELIGCRVTLRKEKAEDFLKRALEAVDGTVRNSWFDQEGNFAFGIEEHINIPGVQYDPQIGIYGMDVCVTIEKAGYRIKRRKLRKKKVPRYHRLDRLQSMRFIRDKFAVRVV